MKEIKDILHLYLGCDVYLGKNLEGKDIIEPLSYKMLYEDADTDGFEEISKGGSGYKLILRPLSDMVEEEKRAVNIDTTYSDITRVYWTPDEIKYLLSKHFDLFGLIENGLAIDKTTTKSQIS